MIHTIITFLLGVFIGQENPEPRIRPFLEQAFVYAIDKINDLYRHYKDKSIKNL